MADRITDEFLRNVANYSWAAYCKDSDLQAIAAELLAARERITQLEQQPPMTLVDFGYGLDLQSIRDDLKFLDDVRMENQQLRTRVGWLDHLDTPEGRAMHATEAVKVENEELRAEVEQLRRMHPLLMRLWAAAKEAASTISMSRKHSCSETFGFLDREPALRLFDALEALRLNNSKETP